MSRTSFTLLKWVACAALAPSLYFGGALPAQAQTRIKFILNWKYQGPQAWFFLAQDKGYFKAEGLDVEFDQGDGSGAAITKVASGGYDAGFGDINALITLAASKPAEAPLGVYMMYNVPPFTIAVKANSAIKTPKDFEGKTLGSAANDGALNLWPAYAKLAKIDASKVTITNFAPNLREQMLQRDQVAGVFGYVNTIAFSAKAMGMDPDKDLRFILFSDAGMDLYSNAIVVSKKLAKEKPEAVKGMLRAINKALAETVANPEAAMDYVMKREPLLKRGIEKERLIATLKMEMSHPEAKALGIGDIDEARFKKSIDTVTETYASPRKPTVDEIFSRAYLPAKADRMIKLF